MSDKPQLPWHSNYLNATAFLGGITFTALVLLMESKEKIPYVDFLIPITALVSFFLIASTIGRVVLASSDEERFAKFDIVNSVFTLIGFFGLLSLIPFFVLPFTQTGAIGVGIVEIIAMVIYFWALGKGIRGVKH